MRFLSTVSLLLICLNLINAQNQHCDSLYFTNGQAIAAEVLEKSDTIIRYTVCGDSMRQQYKVKTGDVTFISTIKPITGTFEEKRTGSAAQPRQKCYNNFFLAGFSPFFTADLTKFHIGYARAITKDVALGVDYTYFDYEVTTNDGFIFSKGSTVKRRTGAEFAISGRFYFKSCLFKGFYLKPGVSHSTFEGSKYVKSTHYSFPDPDNPGSGVYTSVSSQSAQVTLNSIFFAPGFTIRTNQVSLDFNAGLRKNYIKLHDIQNNYTYKSLPVFASISLGLAL